MDDDPRLIDISETRKLVGGLSEPTIRRRVAAGEFPAPVVLARQRGGRVCRIAWVRGEVLAWCRAQIAATRART